MKLNNIKRTFLTSAALLSTISMSAADRFVNFKQGDLLLNANNRVEIYMDANDCKGVSYAAHALLKDIKSVSGATATLTSDAGFLKKSRHSPTSYPRRHHRPFCSHRPTGETEAHQRKPTEGQT